MKTILADPSNGRNRWILGLLDILRDSCPDLDITLPDIHADAWPAYSNMCHGLQFVAMAYDSRIEVGARDVDGEFVPLIVADNEPGLWDSITGIALDARIQAESLMAYHSSQAALEELAAEEEHEHRSMRM